MDKQERVYLPNRNFMEHPNLFDRLHFTILAISLFMHNLRSTFINLYALFVTMSMWIRLCNCCVYFKR